MFPVEVDLGTADPKPERMDHEHTVPIAGKDRVPRCLQFEVFGRKAGFLADLSNRLVERTWIFQVARDPRPMSAERTDRIGAFEQEYPTVGPFEKRSDHLHLLDPLDTESPERAVDFDGLRFLDHIRFDSSDRGDTA